MCEIKEFIKRHEWRQDSVGNSSIYSEAKNEYWQVLLWQPQIFFKLIGKRKQKQRKINCQRASIVGHKEHGLMDCNEHRSLHGSEY